VGDKGITLEVPEEGKATIQAALLVQGTNAVEWTLKIAVWAARSVSTTTNRCVRMCGKIAVRFIIQSSARTMRFPIVVWRERHRRRKFRCRDVH